MSPVDQLRAPSPRVGPEQAAANRKQNARDLLSIVPGPGNVIAAEDAVQAFGDAGRYRAEGKGGKAMGSAALGMLSAFGAVTGFPTSRLAGNAARGAGSRTNIFAGPMAKTANPVALMRAEEMAKAGSSKDEIWRATGWGRGVDGKWRFEIDDSGAALTGASKGKTSNFTGLHHPELEAAYGRLAPVDGVYGPGMAEQGSYRSMGAPLIAAKGRNPGSARSVTLHEFQHGAQDVEGFAMGGNPREMSLRPDTQALAAQKYHSMKKAGANLSDEEMITKAYSQASYEMYSRLAGEVEARNVQTRMNMTAAERRVKAPWLTQDVPDEQQIIRRR